MRIRPLAFFLASIVLLASPGLMAETPEEGYVLARVEYRITGMVSEVALQKYLGIEIGKSFSELSGLESYAGDINRRLRNNRVFDLSSSVTLQIEDPPEGGGPQPAWLVVDARTSTTAVVVPFPKYSSDYGLSAAIRFKDFNFLGSLNTVTANFDYFFDDKSLELGGDFGLPISALGGDWKLGTGFDLQWSDTGLDLDGSVSLGATYSLPGLGKGWTLSPATSYEYDRDTLEHTLIVGSGLAYSFTALLPWTLTSSSNFVYYYLDRSDPYLSESLSIATSLKFLDSNILGPFSYSFSVGPYIQGSLPSLGLRDTGFSLSQSLGADRVDWIGNFRKGAGISISESYTYHGIAALPSDRFDMTLALSGRLFLPFSEVVGLNLRILGRWFPDWTYIGETNDFDWDDEFRGIKSGLRGDAGLVVNLEFPLNLAQGKFFGVEFLSTEVLSHSLCRFWFREEKPLGANPGFGTGDSVRRRGYRCLSA